MITKKHYKRIAEIIRLNLQDAGDNETQRHTVKIINAELVDYFREDNPHFDEDKWEKAIK